MWECFACTEENYTDGDESKTRIKCECNFCGDVFVFRNVEQLQIHIACPTEGVGRQSGCREVKGKALAVQQKYAGMAADREAERVKKKKESDLKHTIAEAEAQAKRKAATGAQRDIASSFSSTKVRYLSCVTHYYYIIMLFPVRPVSTPHYLCLISRAPPDRCWPGRLRTLLGAGRVQRGFHRKPSTTPSGGRLSVR